MFYPVRISHVLPTLSRHIKPFRRSQVLSTLGTHVQSKELKSNLANIGYACFVILAHVHVLPALGCHIKLMKSSHFLTLGTCIHLEISNSTNTGWSGCANLVISCSTDTGIHIEPTRRSQVHPVWNTINPKGSCFLELSACVSDSAGVLPLMISHVLPVLTVNQFWWLKFGQFQVQIWT